MPAKPFSVNLNLDDIARRDIAAALRRPAPGDEADDQQVTGDTGHHGARDSRQAARERSGRARSDRAAGASGGRSYAFRRS
ncbi:hypothetical protein AB0M02_13130 [Actinoplanes sp. NPDC051861]|uniref:hypothetical protein n=1 Tax=Actinoplanes sp. NPDC051861 TaxID=3155170 RepID=UPI00342CF22E